MSLSQQSLNILERPHHLGFCEAASWELISLIGSLANDITANPAEADARTLYEWPEWLDQNGFRFDLLQDFALRTEELIISEASSSVPLGTHTSHPSSI